MLNISALRANRNPLSDDRDILVYADIPGLLKDLDLFFGSIDRKGIRCLAVRSANSLSQTVVLLYLLSAGINFYLHSSYNETDTPDFCDFTLWPGSDARRITSSLRIESNPRFSDEKEFALPRNGAAIFSSSGTTGRPKFILYRQEKLLRNADNCVRRFGLGMQSRVLVPVPTGHMYGLGVGLLPAILSGAAVTLIDKNNVIKFMERMGSFRPTFTLITPTIVKMLLRLDKPLPAESRFVTAGEKIATETWLRFESAHGPLVNLYGSTEMGAMATTPSDVTAKQRSEGLLLPLDGVQIKLSGDGQGEVVCLNSAGFECYVDDNGRRLAGGDGSGWYATRDFGRVMDERHFVIIGRMDNCVNRSGFLVSLDEVSAILETMFPEITQAIVFEYNEGDGLVTGLAAVCELAAGRSLDEPVARRRCKSTMKSHFVPDVIHVVPELPRLANGKPDRTAVIGHYASIISNKNS